MCPRFFRQDASGTAASLLIEIQQKSKVTLEFQTDCSHRLTGIEFAGRLLCSVARSCRLSEVSGHTHLMAYQEFHPNSQIYCSCCLADFHYQC